LGNGELLGIAHVQLAAPPGCEARARKFFSGLLGLKEVKKPENLRKRGGVWFQVGSQQLHIGVEREQDFHPNKKAHPAFKVSNLLALRERLISKNVQVVDDEPLEGFDRFYVSDPFGNRLEFLEAT